MKSIRSVKPVCSALAIVLFSLSQYSFASSEIGASDENQELMGGFIKLGLGIKASTPNRVRSEKESGKDWFINARYQFSNGIFAELTNYRMLNDGVRVGYNFYNTRAWNLDLVTLQAHESREVPKWQDNQISFVKRKSTTMLGLRASGVFNKTTLQVNIAPYSFNRDYDDGIFVSLWLDQSIQYKNWQLYANAGLIYRTKEIINYYYGISTGNSSVALPSYQTGSGTEVSGEVGALYPISQNWMFETYFKYSHMPRSINNSPLVAGFNKSVNRDGHISELGILVSYVF